MSDIVSATDAGLSSLSGFAYQIKVFIMLLSQLEIGQQVEFETLDDVTVTAVPTNDSQDDFCIKQKTGTNTQPTVFQVKQTNVTEVTGRKVLYNWLLALHKETTIEKFTLYVEQGYSVNEKAFTNGAEKEFQYIIESDRAETALVSRVKKIYEHDYNKFQNDYQYICNHKDVAYIKDINTSLSEVLAQIFHSSANTVGPFFYGCRIKELFTRICARIMDNAAQRKPYTCTRNEFEQICEDICSCISQARYEPDYSDFSRLHSLPNRNSEIVAYREYQQLKHCGLSESQIIEHIGWEQYYQNIRQHYLTDARKEKIEETEYIAYHQHQSVVLELKAKNEDIPLFRLLKTKACPISTLTNEISQWGTYIYLTKDEAEKQISWKDESDGVE